MNTTVFKTGTKLVDSTIGVDKVVINIPGGAQTVPEGNRGFTVQRKKNGEGEYDFFPMSIKVYNGSLYLGDNNTPLEEQIPAYLADSYVDDEGNNIKVYKIPGTVATSVGIQFRWTLGTTRIEVLDVDKINGSGLYGTSAIHITEAEFNIEQYAFLPFERLYAFYAEKAYGNLKALKHKNNIHALYASGSNVTGDINNLAASAYNLESCAFYNSKVYGNLNTFLETMKNAGVRNKLFTITVGYTGITYNGSAYRDTLYCSFDANGNYTVTEIEP